MKYFIDMFSSLDSMVRDLRTRERQDGAGEASTRDIADFTGTESYEAADDLALYGDHENAAEVQEVYTATRAKVNTYENETRSIRVRSVVGQRCCVGAAIIGHPLSMVRRKTTQHRRPVVNVYYVMSSNCSVSTERIIRFGAKLAAAIRAAENKGVRTNLYAGVESVSGQQTLASYVKIKDSDKDFNLLRMIYPLAHPSFLRRHYFRLVETTPGLKQANWRRGYGAIVRGSEAIKSLTTELQNRGHRVDAHISFYEAEGQSVERLVERIVGGA